MIIRFLRIFTFLMCAFTTGIVDAHTLHIGNKSFAMSQTKYTTPSLNFMINGEHWYANTSMCELPINLNTNTKLKIKYDNKTYYVFGEEMRQYTQDYIIQNGRLIWANCNLYLQSTGTQYIKSGYYFNGGHAFIDVSLTPLKNTLNALCGTQNKMGLTGAARSLYISGAVIATAADQAIDHNSNLLKITTPLNTKTFLTFYQNNDEHYAILTVGNTIKRQNYSNSSSMITNLPLTIFSKNSPEQQGEKTEMGYYKVYSFKIVDNDILVRHMVPVPAGLQIGDYTVPQNGMWDIVEQKFYGNSGTGTFIYGHDE